MKFLPVVFDWIKVDVVDPDDGTVARRFAMVPKLRYGNVCARQFGNEEGGEHTLVPLEQRSRASHNHFFAALSEAFDNLPEHFIVDHKWTSFDDMRKDLLIEAGYGEEKTIECASEKHAMMTATYIRDETGFCKISFKRDDRGKLTIVRIRRAKSQEHAAMDRQTFEASKKAVLEKLEGIIGLARGELMKHAGKSA